MLLRRHSTDDTLIDMGGWAEDGGTKVVTSIHVDQARKAFGDEAIQALADIERGDWLDVPLRDKLNPR